MYCIYISSFWADVALKIVSRRTRRYLKTVPRLVASPWLNMRLWRAMATLNVAQIM